MQERRDPEPQSTPPDLEGQPRRAKGVRARLPVNRWTLPATLLAAAAIVLVLVSRPAGLGNALPPVPGIPASGPSVPEVAKPLERAVRPQAEPTATPLPTPTPDPDIRPLSMAVMPRVEDRGPAPVRMPGTPDPDPSTDHVIVVDGDSGAVLFQRNGYEPVAPASLTKIMTATLGIEHGSLSDHVTVNVDASSMDGSSLMGLEPWFDVTFEDLLYGLMLPSGNDAALAIARYVAGSDAKFVKMMNDKARWLGLRCTRFTNPHGLDEEGHYSCPADLVTMARYAMQYPLFRQVVETRHYDVRESNISYTIYNVNPILDYPGADGVKTGFSDNAGRALVATAVRNGHRVYVAFMRSENGAEADGTLLLNWAFNSFDWPPGDSVSPGGQ